MDKKNIELIQHNLEETFKQKVWSKKEYKLYVLLLQLVKKYQETAKAYESNYSDIKIIIKNITDQPWYNVKTCNTIIRMIEYMTIENYESQKNHLELTAKFNYFFICIYYHREDQDYEYKICFESLNHRNIGVLIHTTSNSDIVVSPELNKIKEIVNMYPLSSFEIIHICHELLSFYDSNRELKDLNMSFKYPISLEMFANSIK